MVRLLYRNCGYSNTAFLRPDRRELSMVTPLGHTTLYLRRSRTPQDSRIGSPKDRLGQKFPATYLANILDRARGVNDTLRCTPRPASDGILHRVPGTITDFHGPRYNSDV